MFKVRVVVIVMAGLLLIPLCDSAAGQAEGLVGPGEAESQATALEDLLRAVAGSSGLEPGPVVSYGNGLQGISFRLDGGAGAVPKKGKDLQVLAHGHQLSEPSVLSSLINSVSSNTILEYKFWWVVLNSTSSDVDAVTVRKVKGPRGGLRDRERSELTYPANTVQLFWDDPEERLDAEGVYLHKVVVKGFGALKAWFWAD